MDLEFMRQQTVIKQKVIGLKDKSREKVKITYPDLSVYNGDLVKGIPNGTGTIVYGDGSNYSGQWLNGKIDGFGIPILKRTNLYWKF